MNAIEIVGLSKLFAPGVGLRPMTLNVPAGQVFGFLGPNGAGKTTTIRTLLGFLRPSGGQARIFSHDVWQEREAVHARVGYLPGEVHLRPDWTAGELIRRAAALRGGLDTAHGVEVARRLNLELGRRVGTLSKGNRQKVGLVLALMPRPELLVLDEPTDGLDPLAQETVLELLQEARDEGRTVFLSSHVLGEVERVADRVGILRRGELIRVEGLAALRASLPQHLRVTFVRPPSLNLATLSGMSGGWASALEFQGRWTGSPDPLIRALVGESIASLSLTPSSLEDAFLDDYRQEEAHVA